MDSKARAEVQGYLLTITFKKYVARATKASPNVCGAIFPRDGIELATLSDGFLLSQTL